MSIVASSDLDFYVKHNLNLLFIGEHGVGKTHIILDTFERHKLKYRYFSCATMDPWIDFIGVPREMKDGDKTYLDLIRPKDFANDEVEAIFLDEYNRAHKKVRNAVMELIQFKSINGHKFPNLKVVWAAINPDDGNYDTEGMDAAQKDRFHVQIVVPYLPDRNYFANKYGADWSEAACSWWEQLSQEVQKEVSPRRLDYALQILKLGGNIRGTVLPEKSGVTKLLQSLQDGPTERKFNEIFDKKDSAEMKKFLANENNYADCKDLITSTDLHVAFCLPLLPLEKQMSLTTISRVEKAIFANTIKYQKLLESIRDNGLNDKLQKKAAKVLESSTNLSTGNPFADQYERHVNTTDLEKEIKKETK